MKRAIEGALASAGGFILGYFVPTIAFMVVYFAGRMSAATPRPSVFEETVMVVYLAGVYAVVDAIVYCAITSLSRNWRSRPRRQVAAISGGLGVAAQIVNWTGLALMPLLPLLSFLPGKASMLAGIAMPGVLAGAAVLLWSALRPPKTQP